MVEKLAEILREKKLTLSVAESLTGGLLSNLLTNVPGASDWYMGGITSYSNRAKTDLLEVKEATLLAVGAVSAEVAEQMAQGCAGRFKTELALSTTGIAGPGGGSETKPVGLVYLGVKTPQGVFTKKCRFQGERLEIKEQTCREAILWLLEKLN